MRSSPQRISVTITDDGLTDPRTLLFSLFEEIAGTDLIIQFLISANLIEQKTKLKTATENPSRRRTSL